MTTLILEYSNKQQHTFYFGLTWDPGMCVYM